jgi:hypothetical protein
VVAGVSLTVNCRSLVEFAEIDDPTTVKSELPKWDAPHPDEPARNVISQELNVAAAPPDSRTLTSST